MTIVWRYLHTSFFTSRRDGPKQSGLPVTYLPGFWDPMFPRILFLKNKNFLQNRQKIIKKNSRTSSLRDIAPSIYQVPNVCSQWCWITRTVHLAQEHIRMVRSTKVVRRISTEPNGTPLMELIMLIGIAVFLVVETHPVWKCYFLDLLTVFNSDQTDTLVVPDPLQHTAAHCSTLQCIAKHNIHHHNIHNTNCNTLQHTALELAFFCLSFFLSPNNANTTWQPRVECREVLILSYFGTK